MDIDDQPAHRQVYALQLLAKIGAEENARLMAAFARVPREDFVGPPPWSFSDGTRYQAVSSTDPVVLYQDVLVGLDAARGINNGMPSLHAASFHALGIREGEIAVHLGAGTGYYTAIMAELVGPSGRVIAIEYDVGLAKTAKANLAGYPNVEVIQGDAGDWPKEDADVIYANFALDHPPARWVDNLAVSGRLLFPLGTPAVVDGRRGGFSRYAAFLMIDRRARGFGARFLQPVGFIWGEGKEATPPGRHAALETAFRGRGLRRVRSFRWQTPPTGDEWYGEEDWGLSFDEV
ncbi:protein-L-isoaspartate(D-aspartate) O-methyltransferase [Rhizobium sp. NFR07]|uniref:protein-L-isoaspartate O-methyltransferase family protein n=1 Tax=Rhizobium sp. NFR07 TaxID=1566262 RepID=UPI0008ECC896|nr:methyltransferase domain-containing protein [Rhizobium sp. NFR07]SFB58193.1 protein-L-isoaspartate(D-aspartate) O-methyltransferase [Rhizobium sp. NFR07]